MLLVGTAITFQLTWVLWRAPGKAVPMAPCMHWFW